MIGTPLVFVVDDDPSVRKAVARLLNTVGLRTLTFSSPAEFLEYELPQQPSCLILDVELPGMDGLELQRKLIASECHLPIVFISGHGDIPMSVRAMKTGAVDFLAKPFSEEVLLRSVRQALEQSQRDLATWTDVRAIRGRYESLSPREREVLAHVVSGELNKQIGRALGVTEKTVKVHRGQVMRKMAAGSLAELVRLAQKIGISTLAESRAP